MFEDGFYTVRGETIPVDAAFAYNVTFKKFPSFTKAIIKLIYLKVNSPPVFHPAKLMNGYFLDNSNPGLYLY